VVARLHTAGAVVVAELHTHEFGYGSTGTSLLGLDETEQVSALSLASGTASGVCEWAAAGTADLFFQNAHAARSGLVATMLAAAGARAADGAVDGRWGLHRAISGSGSAGAIDRTAPLAVDEVYFKTYPSCAFTQEAIDVAARLAGSGIDPTTVERIDVDIYSAAAQYPGCDNGTDLDSTLARQMSIQFAVAATMVDGNLRPAPLAGNLDPTIAGLAARTRVLPNPAVDHLYLDQRLVAVTVVRRNGATIRQQGGGIVGLTDEQVVDKFQTYAEDRLGPTAAPLTCRRLCERSRPHARPHQ
jgi:2-methylcitrate dehydratase PrpD